MSGVPTGGGGKSRIVIDVDKIRQESRARRPAGVSRGGKILSIGALVVLFALAAAAAGGYLWWRSYKQSPTYSLALLVDAAQRDDLRAVEQLIDADRVAEGFVPQVVEKLVGSAGTITFTTPGGQIEAAMPQLMPRVREGVRDEVARGVKSLSEKTGGRMPFVLLALGLRRYADVKEEGDAAAVALNTEGRATELRMERSGERWKVVTIRDDALASSIAARVAPNIPAALAKPPEKPARARPPRR